MSDKRLLVNIPNALTLLRIVLAFFVLFFLTASQSQKAVYWGLMLFLTAAFTDYLDGALARKKGLVSRFGQIMDPVADKLLIILTLSAFCYLRIIQGWMVGLIILRELIITALRIQALSGGRVIAAKDAGKIKTFLQMGAIMVLFFVLIYTTGNTFYNYSQGNMKRAIDYLMLIVVLVTIISGVSFLKEYKKVNKG
ncbi:MAG: CDP-diacylglycerol--glycerol-3-phosphate 3-phosphatidyltransferase [Candidatus Omnitrophica bacterium]|nr:CDP-diacylglycerol--glycerol-3-phosphate 3-phosphatidyltransferase [Candidatus Omnitrophota bacterium]